MIGGSSSSRYRVSIGVCLAMVATAVTWGFIVAYGYDRLEEARGTLRPGPVVSVVQPDVPFRPGIFNGFDPDKFLEEMIVRSSRALSHPTRLRSSFGPRR